MWMRADALKEVGVLDELFMYGEDIDLSWRLLWWLGESLLFSNPNHHYKGESTRKPNTLLSSTRPCSFLRPNTSKEGKRGFTICLFALLFTQELHCL